MSWDLRLVDVGKRYRVGRSGARRWRASRREFWAVRHVTMDVAAGSVLGIIGPNGAGKSTLLKLLSGITAPTEGEIRIRGRLAALIEVGSGFHPELTGRENVFLSGTILGLRRRDIAARLESIAEFAGVGGFLDEPVKHYSSGMYVRLGFAVAAQLEPDVLLVDEVLAVGDAAFQARCLQRIMDLRQRGTTIVFISHDLGTVERLCDRAVLLQHGAIAADGAASDVVTAYQRSVNAGEPTAVATQDEAAPARPVRIAGLTVRDEGDRELLLAKSGDPVAFAVDLDVNAECPPLVARVMVYSFEEGVLLFECATPAEGLALGPGRARIRFDMPWLGLLPGPYTLGATVQPAGSERAVDWWFGRTTLHVEKGPTARGHVYVPYHWSVAPLGDVPGRTAYTTVQ